MHISPAHKARDASITGLVTSTATVAPATETGPLAIDQSATYSVSAVPLVSGSDPIVTVTPTTSATSSPSNAADASGASSSSGSQIPIGTVIGICVGVFLGLAVLLCLFWAWCKRSNDKLSAAARRNAAGKIDQDRARDGSFNRLGDAGESPEKRRVQPPHPPPPANVREPRVQELEESDEKNFSMFKKSPSVRTAYTHKSTTDDEHAFDLPQLEFTKYHPTLAEELSLAQPEKPFATAAAAVRQNSGVSWDGETLGDDSFLSMRSVRVESGTMSPTMVMAKMTPPATASALHKWESAEVVHMEEDDTSASTSRNPFAEMAEERKSRSNNPFFNAQDMHRNSRAARSRSNSRTSRTSRAQSLVRSDSRATVTPNMNPFLDLHETFPAPSEPLPTLAALPTRPHVPSDATFGSERAMASLIAALDLSKEEVEARLRVVSMQGSTVSAYSEATDDDAVTVREFPLPPTTTPHSQ